MAESVDALVSNTSGETHPGSSPGLGTAERLSVGFQRLVAIFFYELKSIAAGCVDSGCNLFESNTDTKGSVASGCTNVGCYLCTNQKHH